MSAALVEAGAPLSDISRRLYRTKPDAQLRLFGRSSTASSGASTAGSSGRPCATRTSPRRARSAPHSEGIIDLLAQAEDAEVAILFKEAEAGDADQRADPAGRRRRHRADRDVRRRRPCPGGRRDRDAAARRGARRRCCAEAERLIAALAR